MADMLKRLWFKCPVSASCRGWYVVTAYDITEARRILAGRASGALIELLTWEALADLTGCMIPAEDRLNEPAVDNIAFDRDSKISFLIMRD